MTKAIRRWTSPLQTVLLPLVLCLMLLQIVTVVGGRETCIGGERLPGLLFASLTVASLLIEVIVHATLIPLFLSMGRTRREVFWGSAALTGAELLLLAGAATLLYRAAGMALDGAASLGLPLMFLGVLTLFEGLLHTRAYPVGLMLVCMCGGMLGGGIVLLEKGFLTTMLTRCSSLLGIGAGVLAAGLLLRFLTLRRCTVRE